MDPSPPDHVATTATSATGGSTMGITNETYIDRPPTVSPYTLAEDVDEEIAIECVKRHTALPKSSPFENCDQTFDQQQTFASTLQCMPLEEVVADFGALVDCEELGDVQFVFNDGGLPLYANRALLAVRCEYFRQLFYGTGAEMADGRTRRVEIQDCPREAFRALLQLVCTGSLDALEPVLLVEVHALLDRYDLRRMSKFLRSHIVDLVTEPTILATVEAAHRANQHLLRDDLIKKIVSTGMRKALEGGSASIASKEILLQIARHALPSGGLGPHHLGNLLMASRGPVRVVSEHKIENARVGLQAREIGIFGDMAGWTAVMLAVPRTHQFTVMGVCSSANSQVYLWIWKLERDENGIWKLPASPNDFRCGPGPCGDGSKLRLSFVGQKADKPPIAVLSCNGDQVLMRELPADGGEYRPVLICGDWDGLSNLSVE